MKGRKKVFLDAPINVMEGIEVGGFPGVEVGRYPDFGMVDRTCACLCLSSVGGGGVDKVSFKFGLEA